MSQKTEFTVKEDGFHGQLFKSDREICPNKAMIVCTGSDGNMEFINMVSQCFSEHGITSLGICFFNAPDTPSTICEVPLEYIEKGAKYLKSIGYEKVGIWGVSMGSVYVLLSACYYPELINFVVAPSPLYFVFEAVDKNKCSLIKGKNAFSFKGEPIPFEPAVTSMSYFKFFIDSLKKMEPSYASVFEPLMGKVAEEHIIPLEKMKASLILISGKMDTLWPSTESGERMIERLKAKNYAYPYQHVICEHGGHYMIPPLTLNSEKALKANRKYPEDAEKYKKEHMELLIDGFKTF